MEEDWGSVEDGEEVKEVNAVGGEEGEGEAVGAVKRVRVSRPCPSHCYCG